MFAPPGQTAAENQCLVSIAGGVITVLDLGPAEGRAGEWAGPAGELG